MSENRIQRPDPPAAPPNWREWRQEHLTSYLATNGETGHIMNSAPALLLTTKGRKSGKPYTTPLIYGRDGDRYLVVASYGGAGYHPDWYLNLVANPEIEVQVLADKFEARAQTSEGDERARLWKTMTAIFPNYDDYQVLTTREIPVVIIERV